VAALERYRMQPPYVLPERRTIIYGNLIWSQIPEHIHKVVVVPLGSLEQHGHHLPLLTDTMIGAEVAHRAEQEWAIRRSFCQCSGSVHYIIDYFPEQ
jgi:Creatinine amidohydrolase